MSLQRGNRKLWLIVVVIAFTDDLLFSKQKQKKKNQANEQHFIAKVYTYDIMIHLK